MHGLGQTSSCWQSTLTYLPKQSAAICPNLFELCTSPDISYQKLYKAFVAYCDKFTQPLNLCGISLGAILALNYAIDFPKKVHSLVLIAPQFKMPRYLMKLQNIIFNILPEKMFLKSGVVKNNMIQLSKTMLNLDFSGKLERIVCPVLVVCGAKDYVNQKAAKTLTNRLTTANYYMIKNAGHEVNIEAPKSLALAIEQFYENINALQFEDSRK